MVNGHDSVYVERRGRIEPTAIAFESEQALRDAIERILAPGRAPGRRALARWPTPGSPTARG